MNGDETLRATLRALLLFDVAEEIDLTQLSAILGKVPAKREPSFVHVTPEYVRYERTPVVDQIAPVKTGSGESLSCRVRYFDYGVASIELQLRIEGTWSDLIRLANRWIESPELEASAKEALREHLRRTRPAARKPYDDWVSEEYYIVQLDPIRTQSGLITAEQLLKEHGAQVSQLVRGEESPLSPVERQEVLQGSMSYYPTD
jgi:hypothetical protein